MLLPEKYESIFDVSSEGPSLGSLVNKGDGKNTCFYIMNKSRDKIKTNEMDLIKTKYKQKIQIILQYKKLWGKLEIVNIIKANVGKYTRKGRNVKVSEAVKGQVKTEEVKGMRNVR